jgi:hypothetical protein
LASFQAGDELLAGWQSSRRRSANIGEKDELAEMVFRLLV